VGLAELRLIGLQGNEPILPEPFETRRRKSWDRIFEVETRRETNSIQATVERLALEDIRKVTEFVAIGHA
jgi:hypothetical protein